ncbi:MAG: endonuclease/exonuclease/phosphatase family protein [Saprospiraceae bacterium]|nr:endonuclease/exonuclease/phosphatase family protein [Saprospiraceae bacterium]
MKIIKKLFFVANILLTIVTLLMYLSPYLNPKVFWWLGVMSLAYPWVLLLHFLMIIVWLFSSSRKWGLLSLFTILLGWNYFTGIVGIRFSKPQIEETDLLVMSYNIQSLKVVLQHSKSARPAIFQEMETYFAQLGGPDIICVQDMIKGNEAFFKDYFKLKNKYILKGKNLKTAIFTKYPIVKKGEILFDNSFNSAVWADVKVNKDTFRVFSVHLESNRITGDTEELLQQGDPQDEKSWLQVRNMFAKYKRAMVKRVDQSILVAEQIAVSPHPVIIGGDLNDTPLSYAYRTISRGTNDAFRKKGRGIGTTYAGSIPGLRIDYIFADKSIKIIDHHILKDKAFSDHYPVMSNIRLPQPEENQ